MPDPDVPVYQLPQNLLSTNGNGRISAVVHVNLNMDQVRAEQRARAAELERRQRLAAAQASALQQMQHALDIDKLRYQKKRSGSSQQSKRATPPTDEQLARSRPRRRAMPAVQAIETRHRRSSSRSSQ